MSLSEQESRTGAASSEPRVGWGGRIRTSKCEIQSLVPYRLATPHQQNGVSVTDRGAFQPLRGDGDEPDEEPARNEARGDYRGLREAVNRGRNATPAPELV